MNRGGTAVILPSASAGGVLFWLGANGAAVRRF